MEQWVIFERQYTTESKRPPCRDVEVCFGSLAYQDEEVDPDLVAFVYYPRPPCWVSVAGVNVMLKSFSELWPELEGLNYNNVVCKGVSVDPRVRSVDYILNLFRFVRIMAEEPWCLRYLRGRRTVRENLGLIMLMSYFDESKYKLTVDGAPSYLSFHEYCKDWVHPEALNNFFNNLESLTNGVPWMDDPTPTDYFTERLFGSGHLGDLPFVDEFNCYEQVDRYFNK